MLVDENDYPVFSPTSPGKGFNLHSIADWSQQTFNDIYTVGARFNRIICRWDDFEPNAGMVPTSKVKAMDHTVARHVVAGLYCMIDWHLMAGAYPAWTGGEGVTVYTTHGQYLTQWFAKRYGAPTQPINVAAGKTCTVSSTQAGHPSGDAVDGSIETRWAADFLGYPAWITVDLGADTTIDTVKVLWEDAYASSYTVQTAPASAPGTFTVRATHTGITNAREVVSSFSPVSCRYVKINATAGTGNNMVSIWDINISSSAGSTEANPTYTKAMVGLGLNELPTDANADGVNAARTPASSQSTMIGWFRAYAPGWIGFVCLHYAIASPLHGDGSTSSVRTDLIDATADQYAAVGGNVVYDLHDYTRGDTRTTQPYDAYQYNSARSSTTVITDEATYPSAYGGNQTLADRALRRLQMAAYLKPYKNFSTGQGVPFMVGEWSWHEINTTTEAAFAQDKLTVWATAGPAIQIWWDYNVTSNRAEDAFAARPGGTWRTAVTTWMAG